MTLTIDQALQKIHREYEGDTDYLEFDDEETTLRIEYLKDSIKDWYDMFPTKREQFQKLQDAADGDTQTSAGITEYDCPTNFIRHTGFVKLGDSIYLRYIAPDQMDEKLRNNSNEQWYTILGYPGAFRLIINPAQGSTMDINYDYVGEATLPASTTDKIPVARPLYCVYYTLWKIYKEDDPEQEEKYKNLMDEEVRKETLALALTPGTPTRLSVFGAGFGQKGSSLSDINTNQ